MNKQEAIKRLCAVSSSVAGHFSWEHPSDCFCEYACYANPIISAQIIKFIEIAVEEKIAREMGE